MHTGNTMAKKLFLITIIVIGVVTSFGSITCTNSKEIALSPIPRGWVPGTEGWIPPLSLGLSQPRSLTEEEWNRVIEIASTDPEVIKQSANGNIGDMERWWVVYGGGPGFNRETDSNITSGKARLPTGARWYYPATLFLYRMRTDRGGQLVAVDLNTGKVVLSNGYDGPYPPPKPKPPGPGG